MIIENVCESLAKEIEKTYEEGVTLEQSERLAARCLDAQIKVSQKLKIVDLDARMRKSGVKAIRAAVYMKLATASDKKPSDVMLQSQVDLDEIVQKEQDNLSMAEVNKEELERYLGIFKDAHIYYRNLGRGKYD